MDAVVEVVPERDAELAAGLLETGKGVAAAAAQFAARPAADLAPFDIVADVVLAAVSMQRDVRAQQDQEQLALMAIQPLQGRIEGGKGGLLREDRLKACLQRTFRTIARPFRRIFLLTSG